MVGRSYGLVFGALLSFGISVLGSKAEHYIPLVLLQYSFSGLNFPKGLR